MRSKTILGAAVSWLFFMGVAAPSAMAAPPSDACSLLTKAQLSAAIGAPMGEGQHSVPTSTKLCVWAPPGGPKNDVGDVLLTVESADGWAMGKMMMEQAAKQQDKNSGGLGTTPASGVGDEAFYSIVGKSYAKLNVKKGNVAFHLTVDGAFSREKKEAIEKTLALHVVSKL
jgi:hypothetical protein